MALSDPLASRKQLTDVEERANMRRAQLERAAAIEAARASDVRQWHDSAGTVWSYVLLDGVEAQIVGCDPHAPSLAVPHELEGRPVVALAADALAHLPAVEELVCPSSVVSVGPCAFRHCVSLRRIVFPSLLASFDSDWLRGCVRIECLVLPGQLGKIDASIFDLPNLRTLVVGAGTFAVEAGAFQKSALTALELDKNNPFLMTDGRALYGRGGRKLLALAVPGSTYQVIEGCRAVGKKGLSGFAGLRHVDVPESLEVLESFSFAHTGIESFEAPSSLKMVGEKAFFQCSSLKHVNLNEGLVVLDDDVFSATGISALHIPATVEKLGNPLAARTSLTCVGANPTLTLSADSAFLELDGAGGLYRKDAAGKRLLRLMDPDVQIYVVQPQTVAVEDGALVKHAHIEELVLPEGLVDLGQGAFKGCRALKKVALPASLQRIGDEAFFDTSLAAVHVPASVRQLGANALVTYAAHHGQPSPALRNVSVDAASERFYTTCGLLLERTGAGRARVILCTGSAACVRIPSEVDEIAPYAFNGVGGISDLHLSDRITKVGIRGLAIDNLVDRIVVDLEKPLNGRTHFEICFPPTDRGMQQQALALSVPDHVDVAELYDHYDSAIINASSFDAQHSEGLGVYEQAVRIVERLSDPVLLSPSNRSMCERTLRSGIEKICVEVAKHDDRKTIDALFDLGYLNVDNLYAVIERVGRLQDAAMTGYLLEAKRVRFRQSALDFDL